MMKHTLITVLAATAISTSAAVAPAIFSPAAAQASLNFGVTIGTPPPEPVYEAVPVPRAGYVWAPGYWRWENERHVWAPGHWMEARRGYHWVPDRWDHGEHGWGHVRGHWDHDGDRHGFNEWRR
ncbi:MAG: YXWGXW repeat-containing protein [Reyranellales bacterium]